jgi:hypothetical protein
MVKKIHEQYLYDRLPLADRRRLQLFCLLMRNQHDAAATNDVGRRILQKARLFITRSSCGSARDQLQEWVLEWAWLHGCDLPFRIHWPQSNGRRTRLLTLCLASGRLPPIEAWPWLADTGISTEMTACWPRVWTDGITALLAADDGTTGITGIASICLLAGTSAVTVRELPVISWQNTRVHVLFRQVYSTVRKAKGHGVSQLEQEWWCRVTNAFPKSRPVRHYRLPGSRMHLDIYWPAQRVGLEVQGTQHWQPVERYGGTASFTRRQETDAVKRAWCRSNGIQLVEVTQDTPVSSALSRLSELVFSETAAAFSLRRAHRAP